MALPQFTSTSAYLYIFRACLFDLLTLSSVFTLPPPTPSWSFRKGETVLTPKLMRQRGKAASCLHFLLPLFFCFALRYASLLRSVVWGKTLDSLLSLTTNCSCTHPHARMCVCVSVCVCVCVCVRERERERERESVRARSSAHKYFPTQLCNGLPTLLCNGQTAYTNKRCDHTHTPPL